MSNFKKFVEEQRNKCAVYLENYMRHKESSKSCPPDFDGNFCWPPTPIRMSARVKCPLVDSENETISRWCSANTTEIGNNITLFTWQSAQYADCSLLRGRAAGIPYSFTLRSQHVKISDDLQWLHDKFYVIDQVGYILSTVCLFIALCIFWKFSQLQDTRVKIHINLFAAILLRTLSALINNLLYGYEIFFTMLSNKYNYEDFLYCRVLVTLSNYFKIAMFACLLIEGWYFYSFISRAPFGDNVRIKWHLMFSWVSPLVVMIPWVITHMYAAETNFCWLAFDMKVYIISIPVLLIILANLCFFILNVRVVFLKMKCTFSFQRRTHYCRWIKSSFMLVPLFGTYDILYGIGPWISEQQTKIVFLFIVRIICAYQGSLVATLYCFTNSHVKKEVQRAWKNWKLTRNLEIEISRKQDSQKSDSVRTIQSNDPPPEKNKQVMNAYDFDLYI